MRSSVALGLGALVAFSVAAAAQQTAVECLCVLPAEAGPGVAAVQDVRGQVLLSDTVGYTPIQSRAELSIGDRVILLSDGQAVLAAGPTCQVALAPDSVISLIPTDAGVCVAHASTALDTYAVIRPALTPSQLAGLLVSSGLVATGVVGAILSVVDDADPVSP